VIDATGFELILPKEVGGTEPPTIEELRLLREKIDPHGYFLKKTLKE
jgi:glutaconate CoA-transferase subunit B